MPPLMGAARYIAASGVGFAAGMTLGLCGWGGAQVIKPSLTSGLLGLSQLASSGVSLSSLSCAASVGAFKFAESDCVDVRVACAIALPSMLGVRHAFRAKVA